MNEAAEFNAIYDSNVDDVYRFCLRAVSRPAVAEDITGEVFLLLHERQHELQHAQLSSWLLTMARRRAAEFWRHHYVEQRWPHVQLIDPVAIELHPFSLETVIDSIEALDNLQCAVLILRFRHQMSFAEIGYQLKLSETEVKKMLRAALKIVRENTAPSPGKAGSAHE